MNPRSFYRTRGFFYSSILCLLQDPCRHLTSFRSLLRRPACKARTLCSTRNLVRSMQRVLRSACSNYTEEGQFRRLRLRALLFSVLPFLSVFGWSCPVLLFDRGLSRSFLRIQYRIPEEAIKRPILRESVDLATVLLLSVTKQKEF